MEVLLDINLSKEDEKEVLRYLEYHGQAMDDELRQQIEKCIEAVNRVKKPLYILREFEMTGDTFPKELDFLKGEDIKRHLAGCKKIILFAATIGSRVEMEIRRAQIRNVGDALIMDSCASVLIEVLCDTIEAEIRDIYSKENKYLTTRYSPGYGDLPITAQKDFSRLLDTSRKIGLTVTESGIMVPRKSVTAIMGVSDKEIVIKPKSCADCNIRKACRFLRRGVTCGR